MHIDIAQRLRPYSHTAGTCCLIPGTHFSVQVFPCLLRIHDVSGIDSVLIAEIPIHLQGPVDQFLVTLDLERGWVRVEGRSLKGFFRYLIAASSSLNNLVLVVEKSPEEPLFSKLPSRVSVVSKEHPLYNPPGTERLSLGNHKAQDWDLVMRRQDLTEVFPAWLRLGQLMSPAKDPIAYEGTAALLKSCEVQIKSGHPERILPAFQNLFKAGFYSLLMPRLKDDQYQGIAPEVAKPSISPVSLLQAGARLIRCLFIDIQSDHIRILPALPPEFHSGRLLHAKVGELGFVDMEWSKKSIRRMVFHALKEGSVTFRFHPDIKKYRLQGDSYLSNGESIDIQAGQSYELDRFQG